MNVKENKTILMIYDHLQIGGIETLIIRASKWLVQEGYEVKLILRNRGKLFNSLDRRVKVRVYNHLYELLYTPLTAQVIFSSSFFSNIDIVYTFRPESLWIASVLTKVRNTKLRIFNCVYHPYEFFINGKSHYQTIFFSKILMSQFPKKNLAFMNLPCKSSHEYFFKTTFKESFIFPLPVINDSYLDVIRKPVKFKLVSIGNLKSFKSYNIYMVDIVERLIQKGFPVEYEIYGEGELRSVIQDKINMKGLGEYVKLKGQVDYENFSRVLESAYLFIGVGTAAIEAAFCKVPTIVAIGGSFKTYGYIYDMPGFAVGEKIEGAKELEIEDLIRRVFLQTNDEYKIECLRNYNYALKYDMKKLMNELLCKFKAENGIEGHLFEDISSAIYYQFYFNRIATKLNNFSSRIYAKFF